MNARRLLVTTKTLAATALVALSTFATAGSISTFSNRALFDAAVGPTTLETFTNNVHTGIPGGVLSSATSFGTLAAGDIKPGAVYSTTVGDPRMEYFNIDSGVGIGVGFLDGFAPLTRDLTITYSPLVAAFGFDTNAFMPDFDLSIYFSDGTSYSSHFSGITDYYKLTFFGFQSTAEDITSVVISGNGDEVAFAIDNHAFGGRPAVAPEKIPEPATLGLFLFGLAGYRLARGAPLFCVRRLQPSESRLGRATQ